MPSSEPTVVDSGDGQPHPAPPPDLVRSRASLVADMHLALLSEIGARSIHDHLRRVVRDPALQALLARLNEEGQEVVAALQDLIRSMGGRPRKTSFRRRVLARCLALASRVERSLSASVELDTDTNAGAAGEARLGAGRGAGRVLYIGLGTGVLSVPFSLLALAIWTAVPIGLALVARRRLLRGES